VKTISGIAVFVAAFLLAGCISTVDIGLESSGQEYVLNCILNPGQDTVTAWLTKSRTAASGETFETVTGAEITLYENGIAAGRFSWSDSSAYVLPFSVTPEKSYRIEANTDGKTIWAETKVPNPADANISVADSGDHVSHYIIRLNDNKEEENFYWVTATNYNGENSNIPVEIALNLYSNFGYADNFNQKAQSYWDYKFQYDYYIRFTDKGLPDKITEVLFYSPGYGRNAEVFLLLPDYHLDKYMKSSLLLQNMDLYAEEVPIMYSPFPMYSNINGGTGIFGSFNSVSKVFTKN